MPEHSGLTQGVKRSTSDVEATQSAPSNTKRPRVDQSPETSTRRDTRKRKKRRKKEPVVAKLDRHHVQDSSPQPQRTYQKPRAGSKVKVPSEPLGHESNVEKNSERELQSATLKGNDSSETANFSATKQPPDVNSHPTDAVPEGRISQLTKELAEKAELLTAHQSVLSNICQALTCQICLDVMYKPYALAPPGVPAIVRKKTCPHCRAVVRDRPAEIWTIKNLAHLIVKSGLANVPPHPEAQANVDRPCGQEAENEPRRGEDVGMLDMEDGGIYRCLDCMHEIWDGVCTSCGRRYPGHEEGEDWSDDELGLDFGPGVEEFDPEDDPGWIGLEEGEGDDEDDGLAIADWYPGLPVFRWRFGFHEQEEEDDGEDDEDEDEDEEAALYDSCRTYMSLPMTADDEDRHSLVDADLLSEEDEPSLASRPGRTAPIVVSSDEDEDELDDIPAIRPSRPRRGRLIESDDEVEVLGSSDSSRQ
ncbi:hypothetical protein BD769DRAFT_1667015 [Suillus cothurnatus]|nr:hypothetical protein BD769DRAFT_1667015 [Suillus cothurnatus]